MRLSARLAIVSFVFSALIISATTAANAGQWRVGVAKVDITPNEPLRLSGYSGRKESHTAVADSLHVRALVLQWSAPDNDSPNNDSEIIEPLLLVSIDSIAVTGSITNHVADWLRSTYGIARSQLVLSSTHSHAAPHLPSGLPNLFQVDSTDEQIAAAMRYEQQIIKAIQTAIDQALSSRVNNARVEMGAAEAAFAVQRRVIENGKWINFGVQPDGQVDRRVRVLRITDADGKLIAAAYQYACHCTSLGPEFNQISGDWAGLSASRLEEMNAGALFLPIIGCGGDANPNPRGSYDAAVQNAMQMVDSVSGVLRAQNLHSLPPPAKVQYGFVGLEPEQPTAEQMQELADSQDPNQHRWVEHMKKTRLLMGRLPESSPMPVHVWTFGEALNWIFLGGEVVVDYQYMLEKEMPTSQTWVAAYCNDVLGYVASEQQRAEGGYEVDYSMIYYLQPGRWKSGTQSNILTRVREISRQDRSEDEPLSADEGLLSMKVPDGYQVDQVACEPLIQDPVNLSFGWDGSVWVVEMSDYPAGTPGGGCVRVLRDSDGDGVLDRSVRFLDQLNYPTSVHPWRDGAIVIAAPDIIYAHDTDGDSVADQLQVLLSGIAEVNPQHRASGFELGLDGRLHFAVGDGTRKLISHRNGVTYDVRGHDVAWNPDTGEIDVFVNGHTQFIPGRDEFGNWFGNNNSEPMYQFVFRANDLGGQSVDTGSVHQLLTPSVAPPVFPRSRTLDRFNDLYTRDRYTSACGSIIVRVPGLQPADQTEESKHPVALICEPVHNLVARIQLQPDGSVYSAVRHPEDAQYDFFASTDPWSRPVRVVNAPDGSLWVVDMYRHVIEHPQWIPVAWQKRINVRGGEGMGRIYRVYHHSQPPGSLKDLSQSDPLELLQSSNSVVRDMVMQAIVTDQISQLSADQLQGSIRDSLRRAAAPEVTASLLGILAGKGWLRQADMVHVLQSTDHPQLVRWTLELAAQFESPEAALQTAVQSIPEKRLGASVDLRWILTALRWPDFEAQAGLLTILGRGALDRWLSAAMTLADTPQMAVPVLRMMLAASDANADSLESLQNQSFTAGRFVRLLSDAQRGQLLNENFPPAKPIDWTAGQVLLLVALRDTLEGPSEQNRYLELCRQAIAELKDAQTPENSRQLLALILGNQLVSPGEEVEVIEALLKQPGPAVSLAVRRSRYVPVDELADSLLAAWDQLSYQDQSTVASALMVRPAWREELVGALERGLIKVKQLPPSVVQSLTGHYDRNLRSRAVAVFGRPSPRQSIVADYLSRMPNPATDGQAATGEKLYIEHCAVCHASKNGVAAIAPTINNLSHWNNEQWIAAVMDPSLAVEEKYKQTVVLTLDDEIVSGIVLDETATSLKIVGSDGQTRQLAQADLAQRKLSTVSLMPDGFEVRISPQQLADLIHFLRTK